MSRRIDNGSNSDEDGSIRSPIRRILIAGILLQLLRTSLQPPGSGTSIIKFVPVLLAHLAAPQLSVFCAAYAAKSILGANQAMSLAMKSLHALGAALFSSALACCVVVVRHSMSGRTAFSDAVFASLFGSASQSLASSPVGACADSTETSVAIGQLNTCRIAQMGVGIPLLEHPRLDITRDIEFAVVDGERLCLDAIRKKGLQAGSPTLLYVHGGGFIMGDKSQHSLPLLYHVALKMGWLVVSINYRLASWRASQTAAVFPDFLHDSMRAVAWARSSEAKAFGGGGSVLAVAGESAGAQLASLLGFATAGHAIRMRPSDLVCADLRVDAVVDLYGCHNTFAKVEYFQHIVLKCSAEENEQLWQDASPVWWAQQASRLEDVAEAPPPFLTIHGTHDSLVPIEDAREFAQVLKNTRKTRADAMVPDVYVEIPRAIHAFNMIHNPLTFALHDTVVVFLRAVAKSRESSNLVSKL